MSRADHSADPGKRLTELESRIESLETRTRHWTDIVRSLAPIISTLIVVAAGYWLTGRVNAALQHRQLELSGATAMRSLMQKLGEQDISREQAEGIAITLSAYGRFAVPPLMTLLESGKANKVLAAKTGLRAVGMVEPEPVCDSLIRALDNRTRLYSWETQLWVVPLAGQLNCRKALHSLEDFETHLEISSAHPALEPYSKSVRKSEGIDLPRLLEAIADTRAVLDQQARFDEKKKSRRTP